MVSGLSVRSEIVLPGLAPAGSGAVVDVNIRRAPVPVALEGAGVTGPTWQLAGSRFLLRIPRIARFLLRDGREIAFESETESEDDIPIFLLGSVFGILLHQRKQIVLHASAVRVNGKAVVFCGGSGAGKSTLAAALVQRGYLLVTDDVCAISVNDAAPPTVHPDGRKLKLWAHSIDKLALAEQRGDRVRNRLEKFYVQPADASGTPLPLGAVYALREARPPHAPGIERPNVLDAALVLRRSAYRPLLVRRMDQRANYFRAAATIVNTAGVFHLSRALNFAMMPDVLDWLERHWRDTGLVGTAA